jgi:phosphatidylinositol alpha-1,6-mannosyltransferase
MLMRLLVFTTQFPPDVGGVEMMTWQLSRHLQSKGVQVTVLAPSVPDCEVFDSAESLRIARYSLSDPRTILAKFAQKKRLVDTLRHTLRESAADSILCTGWDPCGYVTSIASATSPVPYFLIAHGMELMQLPAAFPARFAKRWMRARTLNRAKRIFAVSQFTKDRVVGLGVEPDRVRVIPNGVDTNGHAPSSRQRNVIATVARLVPRKGHATMLRAMPNLLKSIPELVYKIVGTGPELSRLQSLANELSLNGHVQFCGQVSDIERSRILDECSVFVFPTSATSTDFEGLGIAVLEAMAKGAPAVVTRAGGVPELVEHGHTGLIVEPDDPAALNRAIVDLLMDPAKATLMGEKARLAVNDRYDWNIIVDRYLAEMAN